MGIYPALKYGFVYGQLATANCATHFDQLGDIIGRVECLKM